MEKVDYKDTLNLPNTEFPMRANLPVREPEIIEKWQSKKIYHQINSKNANGPRFSMPDGPPYANGNIHMGHCLNKCLKDFVIKYKSMQGYLSPFIPGWDCHGLPIEHKVTKALGKEARTKSAKEIRELCRTEAKTWVEKQKEQFIRLGILARWEKPYLTLNPDYEAQEVRELAKILENGIVYRSEKPVYWCSALQTALAEAEIEYEMHKSPSIYVHFDLPKVDFSKFVTTELELSCLIWTTTPWTLPSNFGICVREDYDYAFYKIKNKAALIACGLKESIEKETGETLVKLSDSFKGQELEHLKARHPFYDRDSLFILGQHVTLEAGTGCVHTAPGHGQDDYIVGIKNDLPVFSPVNIYGKFTNEVPEYEGINVFKANPLVIERIEKSGHLFFLKEITHKYPHCWRSKTPLIFRATPQWFIKMDSDKYNVRKKALSALDQIEFVPDWGVKRLTSMIENRPDWCLTRQRNWGVPLPIFYCQTCEDQHFEASTLNLIADKMETSGGIEAYYESEVSDLLPENTKCKTCGGTDFKKGTDILDVWFDSGICYAAVQDKEEELNLPADIYLEGSDQHRGWFQTSLLASIASRGVAPYQKLFTHNFVTDAKGKKMSKSQGNVTDPLDLIKKNGAEILRLWAAAEDYGQDLNFSQESYKRVIESYRRFRNTMRFLLGNIADFNKETDEVEYEKLLPIDQWALSRLNVLIEKSTEYYDNFEFFKVMQLLNNYFTVDLSAKYLDLLKDRAYTSKKDSLQRRSAQSVFHIILDSLSRLMAPISSFLSEEVHSFMKNQNEESIFLKSFPKTNSLWNNLKIEGDFNRLFEIREAVTKKLEGLRQEKIIGSSLEAQVTLSIKKEDEDLLTEYNEYLCELFIVSDVTVITSTNEFSVDVKKASGEKCPRCWYISDKIGMNNKHPDVCPKCVGAFE